MLTPTSARTTDCVAIFCLWLTREVPHLGRSSRNFRSYHSNTIKDSLRLLIKSTAHDSL
jgi:hypothetical protein